jgi:hypothetical protein
MRRPSPPWHSCGAFRTLVVAEAHAHPLPRACVQDLEKRASLLRQELLAAEEQWHRVGEGAQAVSRLQREYAMVRWVF